MTSVPETANDVRRDISPLEMRDEDFLLSRARLEGYEDVRNLLIKPKPVLAEGGEKDDSYTVPARRRPGRDVNGEEMND